MAEKLRDYEKKRDFGKTAEPKPRKRAARKAKQPRFVVQEHHARRLHWDLRLEHDGALASWAIPNGIPEDPAENRKAVRTEDHPLEYLDFHGEIPKGEYGAGTMKIWDTGTFEQEKWRDDEVMVVFHGERLTGKYVLFRAGKDEKDWMIHRMDPPADPEREPFPERVVPMLARSAKEVPADEDRWSFEIKWDGVRAIVYSQPGRFRIEGRRLTDMTERYPELRPLNRELGSRDAVLDGEIVAFDDEGRPSFERLQRRMHLTGDSRIKRTAKAIPVVYAIFDLLYLDGRDLVDRPYEERRELLEGLGLESPAWRVPAAHVGEGTALLEAAAAQGLEGVVAKKLGSRYEPGRRSGCWIKVKNKQEVELTIGGWFPGEGKRRDTIGALLVGRHDDEGRLRYAGRVGSGFSERALRDLEKRLKPIERKTSPFEGDPKPPKGSVFVRPELECEVEYTEWTTEGVLRHPVYKGLVADDPDAEPLGELTELANNAAEAVVEGQFFYEKQCPSHRPDWVQTASIWSRHNERDIDFCLANDLPTLVWAANLADLELHTSLALARSPGRPTMMVFDLDPGEPADVVDCCRVGLWVRDLFGGLGLECFPKTSGSKGLQVYVPLNVETSYDETKPFARAVAELLEKQHPEHVVSRMTKSLRSGKVLVDWSQNDEHKTTVCVYSLRAKERPTVSTPVAWDEVEACLCAEDAGVLTFTSDEVLVRVEDQGDLFAPVLTLKQELPTF